MEVEVREENRPGAELYAPGAEVTVVGPTSDFGGR